MDNLGELADERDRLKEEEGRILSELAETRIKLAELRGELQALRKTRDGLNDTVRALKKSRDELRDSSRQSLARLREVVALNKGKDEGSRAEKEMADLEWKIQTSSLEKDEEKRLLNRVRVLETKVGAHRRTRKLSEEVGNYRKDADDIHGKIQELAAQSQQYHLEVVALSERFDGLRRSQEEQKKALDEIRAKSFEVGRRYESLHTMTIRSEKISRREKEKAYKDNLKEMAKRKLSQSGKVSLEELGALMGDEED